jgi:hypothetical protein
MRNQIADELFNNINEYQQCIVADMIEHDKFNITQNKNAIFECVINYINAIRKKKWAGDIEIRISEKIWKRAIIVLDTQGVKRTRFNNNDIDICSPLYGNKPVFLLYKGMNHYNALLRVTYS